MTGERGWHHYYSEAVTAIDEEGEARFTRARVALVDLPVQERDR